ncbi:hypothetical protein D3C86_1436220 [compost metagenome]
MFTDNFLQKHQIRRCAAHRFSQLREDETPVQGGKALVGIDRQHSQAMNGRGIGQRHRLGRL